MISASHNPFADNGIKFFAALGRKLDDPTEERLEAELLSMGGKPPATATEEARTKAASRPAAASAAGQTFQTPSESLSSDSSLLAQPGSLIEDRL